VRGALKRHEQLLGSLAAQAADLEHEVGENGVFSHRVRYSATQQAQLERQIGRVAEQSAAFQGSVEGCQAVLAQQEKEIFELQVKVSQQGRRIRSVEESLVELQGERWGSRAARAEARIERLETQVVLLTTLAGVEPFNPSKRQKKQ
jgi:septal ring factor EnvC (AmiA/AmiB activator)